MVLSVVDQKIEREVPCYLTLDQAIPVQNHFRSALGICGLFLKYNSLIFTVDSVGIGLCGFEAVAVSYIDMAISAEND